MWETWDWFLGWKDPLEKGKATHSSFLPWRSPWTTVYGVRKSRTWLSDLFFYFFLSFLSTYSDQISSQKFNETAQVDLCEHDKEPKEEKFSGFHKRRIIYNHNLLYKAWDEVHCVVSLYYLLLPFILSHQPHFFQRGKLCRWLMCNFLPSLSSLQSHFFSISLHSAPRCLLEERHTPDPGVCMGTWKAPDTRLWWRQV